MQVLCRQDSLFSPRQVSKQWGEW